MRHLRSIVLVIFIFASAARADDTETKIDNLISQMTLEEKVSLIHANTYFSVAGIPRLGIPERWLSDGPMGVREDIGPMSWRSANHTDDWVTYLPCDLALAATWNPDMATAYGTVIGQEAIRRGKQIMLGPALNIQRTPLCGRNWEYMGEDPFLTSRIAVNYIKGEQAQGVASTAKHFAANNQETQRNSIDVELDERALREIYLPAFRAAVQEAGVLCVMGAYNQIRGQHCCENDYLLNKILKGEWGFKGLAMSDWGGVHNTKLAALNGMDLEMGTSKPFDQYFLADPYLAGLKSGEYPISGLDDKVRRNLRVIFALHMTDGGPATQPSRGSINTPEHQMTARKIAEESMVLLKNDRNILPLDISKIHTVAVIGQNADLKLAHGGESAEIKAFYEVTPLEGILNRVGSRVNVIYSQGYAQPTQRAGRTTRPATDISPDRFARAVDAAKAADVVIFVAGLNHLEGYDSEGGDRKDLRLTGDQDDLISQVVAANPNTIVVIESGGAIEMDPWLDQVPAVLQAWYGGMEGGNALARILFGDVNPSGKLPCTFPKKLSDSPAHALNAYPGSNGVVEYKEGILVGYRWFDTKQIEPLFPFGFGLSYTTFDYSNLKLIPGTDEKILTVQCDITNTGSRAGEEVAQVYIHEANPALPRPEKELKGFAKVSLAAGEKKTISIPLKRDAFAYYDPAKSGWVAQSDDFTIEVGSSSRDIRLRDNFHLPTTSVAP
ncbi:MAG: glycoside hydrolase family 3 C-terminal domain-containing protein [Tepidisphaeraceae bacterium]|jgi:beta-glucosidase